MASNASEDKRVVEARRACVMALAIKQGAYRTLEDFDSKAIDCIEKTLIAAEPRLVFSYEEWEDQSYSHNGCEYKLTHEDGKWLAQCDGEELFVSDECTPAMYAEDDEEFERTDQANYDVCRSTIEQHLLIAHYTDILNKVRG